MPRPFRAIVLGLIWAACAFSPQAQASGQTVLPPGHSPPPVVSFDGLPPAASVQKVDLQGKPHPVHARLLADRDAVAPGGTLRLGVHLAQQEGWHTYWRSPGAVGQPTLIDWTAPAGATLGSRLWSAPAWFELAGIVSYGYDDQVLHFVEVTLPQEVAGTVTFGAAAAWLVCEVQCIPGDAALTLELPVDPAAATTPNAYAPLFDHAAATFPVHPTEAPGFAVETALSASPVRPDDEFKVVLALTPTGEAPLTLSREHGTFPLVTPITTAGWFAMADPVVEDLPGGGVKVTLSGMALEADPLPTGEVAGALFQVKVGDRWVRTEVEVPLPFAPRDAPVTVSQSPLLGDVAGLTAAAASASSAETPAPERGLVGMLGLAFLGGILLNIMPCVLPVLTLKLYSLVGQVNITAAEQRSAGTMYTVGIVGSFLVLALAVVLLRSVLGLDVGWGFQFQYPGYVIALGTIVFVFGLSLFGVFEIPALGANELSQASDKEGPLGYLLTGAFATLLATPCSAPFLGTGMGFAFTLPAWGIFLFFAVAGLGLAFPFLLVAWVPALYRFMPRPGAWMEAFKQFLGFTLMATTVWLVDVVASQTGRDGGTGFLVFLMFVGLGCWIFGRWGGLGATRRAQALALGVAVLLSGVAGWRVLRTEVAAAEDCGPTDLAVDDLDFSEEIPWQPFNEANVAALAGRTVFVDFTADWCLTCKVNERTVLATSTVRDAMAEHDVVPLKADWTLRDETITAWLQRYGRAGVPFYLVIPADRSKEPIPLGEVITPDSVVQGLRAGS